MNTKEIGNLGEQKAVQHLVQNNYKIIERNFRKRGFEIDIVAEDGNGVLRFIEVKTIVEGSVEDALFSVEHRNIHRYFMGVDCFLLEHPMYKDSVMSMDVVLINGELVQYYENVTSTVLI